MAGFSSVTGLPSIMFANNASFDGTERGGAMTTNGQLWIGSTVAPNVRLGNLTSTGGTITVTNNSGNINVETAGGAAAIEKVALQIGTTPIAPTGGTITFNGATVAAGTHPVQTNGTGVSTMQLQVQISQAIASTNATNIGLSAFNSAQFTVDANGFVSITNFSPFIYTQINHASSPYTVLATDYYISADPTAGTISILLPNAPTLYRRFVIKDRTGTASTNNISVTTVGGSVTIDGQTTYTIAGNYAAIELLWNGTTYEVY